MLPLSPLRFSTIGKPILRTFEILKIFRFFDNSSRTRAKARAKATARATAMARATARARRTRARAKDRARARDGRTDGRTAGRSYLFSEMRSPDATPLKLRRNPVCYTPVVTFLAAASQAEAACPKAGLKRSPVIGGNTS